VAIAMFSIAGNVIINYSKEAYLSFCRDSLLRTYFAQYLFSEQYRKLKTEVISMFAISRNKPKTFRQLQIMVPF